MVGSKNVSGIEKGFTSITGDARNVGIVFSSSVAWFAVEIGDEYDVVILRERARRLLNQIYLSKESYSKADVLTMKHTWIRFSSIFNCCEIRSRVDTSG